MVSIIVPIIMMVVHNELIRNLLYWLFNLIFPTINAQAIITYILAGKSEFCRSSVLGMIFNFTSIGDDTIGWNYVLLFFHTIILCSMLILIDSGLFSYGISYVFSLFKKTMPLDETRLDSDVLTERQRILTSVNSALNQSSYLNDFEDMTATDHLVVHDLVKHYRGRPNPAVNHLTFGAKRGEAFGLLGFNVSYCSHHSIEHRSIYTDTFRRVLAKQQHSVFLSAMKQLRMVQPISMVTM
jgi:hypothetical protein